MRAGLAAAVICLALPLAGCAEDSKITGGGQVVGDAMTVYSLLPLRGPRAEVARDVVLGVKLALAEADGLAGGRIVNFVSVDVTRGTADDPAERVASAVRDALLDQQLVAAIGDLDYSTARVTVPLFNAAGILHTSTGATYTGFVAPVEGDADPDAPGRYQPARNRTFAALLPTDAAQAVALARATRGPVAIEEETSVPASALAAALRDELGETVDTAAARTIVYVGEDPVSALGVVTAMAAENRRARIVLPQALWLSDLPERLPRRVAQRVVFVTAAGPPPAAFEAAFRERFGRAPGRLAHVGHAAMRAVLSAIERAGPRARRRRAVSDAFLATDPLRSAAAQPFWLASLHGEQPRFSRPVR